MAASVGSPRRKGLVFLSLSVCLSIVFFIGIGAFIGTGQRSGPRPGTDGIGLFLLVAGLACLAAAWFVAPSSQGERPTATSLATGTVMGKAFRAVMAANGSAVFGLVGSLMTGRPILVLVLGGGALAVILLWIVPQGGRLLDELERTADAPAPGPA